MSEAPGLHTPTHAQLTVACPVSHRQEHLDRFYGQHTRCLLAQTMDVQVIYVADGGLQLPRSDERVTVVGVDRSVSEAEALMMALAITDTEYFAALSIRDCYFTDAAARFLEVLNAGRFDMAGGDWELRHAPDADIDRWCFALSALQPCRQWPPDGAPGQRLGSGDGTRSTFGPAPVFRTSALRMVGGYAKRFGDGTPIREIIDFVVWDRLVRTGGQIARVPLVVGSHYVGSNDQLPDEDDLVVTEHRHYAEYGALI